MITLSLFSSHSLLSLPLSFPPSLSLQVDSGVLCSPAIENPEGLEVSTRQHRKRKRSTPSYTKMTSHFVRQLRQAEEIPTDNILVGVVVIFGKTGIDFMLL